MRRRILRTSAFFLLPGVVANVLVAWSCALWSPLDRSPVPPLGLQPHLVEAIPDSYRRTMPRFWSDTQGFVDADERRSFGARFGDFRVSYPERAGGSTLAWEYKVHVYQGGWPFIALGAAGRFNLLAIRSKPAIVMEWRGGVEAPKFLRSESAAGRLSYFGAYARPLPLCPAWPGFAINSILYATALWAMLAGWSALGHRRRRRRGLCEHCAYPVGSNPVCTECGRPLRTFKGEEA